MKKLALIMAVVILGTVGHTQAADYNYGVVPTANWLGYINMFDQSDVYQFEFPEGDLTTASWNFAAGPAQPATLSPNTRLYDENVADPFWVDQITFEANLVCEFNVYQEDFGAVDGNTVNFNFDVIANSLPAGYEAFGFVKVLDAFDTWGTYQTSTLDLVAGAGAQSINLTVDTSLDPTPGGDVLVQGGFTIKGAYVASGSATALTGVEIIPEPATIGLMGIAGLGMFVARRRLKI